MPPITKLFFRICCAYARRWSRQLHAAEKGLHTTYLGTVALFAHGAYAYAAGALLVVVVLLMLAGEE
jgi:hypothetical protein